MEDKLLTPRMLAVMLCLSEQTIYNRHSNGGDLPRATEVRRLLRFKVSDLEAWLVSKSTPIGQPLVHAVTLAEQIAARQSR
ncbi:helix-turn-helix transcriptional regulator [Paraburkholderia elongata]|uniref:DNA-binding protein n=1 Tax=Paraburkholderia elongata TaxID=2675747 RepID=A0A972NN56_9BURK|nr:helix-turn-helix domain-containing protein [Paraburkholderia elongata]NPT54590.1 DNA-binding protein [Paraburkholderia elongata]